MWHIPPSSKKIESQYDIITTDFHWPYGMINIIYPLNTYYIPADVHLLEHILIHQMQDYKYANLINGISSTMFLWFSIKAVLDDIPYCLEYMLPKIYDISSITNESIQKEMTIIHIEEQKYSKYKYFESFFKYFTHTEEYTSYPLPTLHQQIIKNTKPTICINADIHSIHYRQSQNIIENFFSPNPTPPNIQRSSVILHPKVTKQPTSMQRKYNKKVPSRNIYPHTFVSALLMVLLCHYAYPKLILWLHASQWSDRLWNRM